METTEITDMRQAKRTMLGWPFMTFAVSMFVFLFSFSIAIGVPTTARLDRPDLVQAVFISFVSAALFLSHLCVLTTRAAVKDRAYWLIVVGFVVAVFAGVGLVVYRYYGALLNISYIEVLTYVGWSIVGIVGMTGAAKLFLHLMLGKHYTA